MSHPIEHFFGPKLPWWRVPMVWLVLSGPAVVVVAGVVTAFIAIRGADPVIGSGAATRFADRPAVQGRNLAAEAAAKAAAADEPAAVKPPR